MNQRSTTAAGQDKRQHARQETRVPSVVRFGDGGALRCEVRNYSPTGLYLAYVEARSDSAGELVGETIRIGFPVGGGSDAASFSLIGRVTHSSREGFGVFVANMPKGALTVLKSGVPKGYSCTPQGDELDLSPQQLELLEKECASLLGSFLSSVAEDFFRRATESLKTAVENALTLNDRSVYFEGTQELIQREERIRQEFFRFVRERLHGRSKQGVDLEDALSPDELTLMEKAELEDWLDLASVIERIEADNAAQLCEIEQRYGRLIDNPIDRKSNPFGPEAIGRAFRDSLGGMDFERPVRTLLFHTLGQAIGSHAPDLYRQINERLVPVGTATAGLQTPKTQPPRMPPGKIVEPPESAAPAPGLQSAHRSGPGGVGNEHALDRGPPHSGAVESLPCSGVGAPDSVGGAPDYGRFPVGQQPRVRSKNERGANGPELLDLVQKMRQTYRQLPAGAVSARQVRSPAQTEDMSSFPPASLQDLLAALDSLPKVVRAAPGTTAAVALTDALADQLATSCEGATCLSSDARQILESVVGLLGKAKGDFDPISDVGALLERLERPLLKLALKDESFPALPNHPARKVLNLIDQYAAAADDRGKFLDRNLQQDLGRMVGHIALRAGEDPGIFAAAIDKLGKGLPAVLQARRARVARIQEVCESRQRIRTGKARVAEALEQRFGGRSVPSMVLRVLDAGWRHYLVLIATGQDSRSDEWQSALSVLDRLAARLVASRQTAGHKADEAQLLLDELRRGMASVSVDGHLLDDFLDELGDCLAGIDSEDTQSRTLVPVTPGKLASFAADDPVAPATSTKLEDGLRVGDWWEFEKEDISVPMQLVWTSRPPGRCAFANRSGTDRLELTSAQLADRIRSGMAKPGRDLDIPLLERSEITLFDETYRELMHQATHDTVTRLPNRKGFLQSLGELAARSPGEEVHTICIIEFDQFRTIYDNCGVEAAEELARKLAQTVGKTRDSIGASSVLAAFRDDTLALLVPRCASGDCGAVSNLLGRFKDYRFQHRQHRYSIGVNIGLAEYSPPKVTAEEAVRRADSACIAAKSLGRNRIQVYEQASPELKTQETLMEWAGRIDFFLEGAGLYLRCQRVQPIAIDSSALPYYEILLGIRSDSGKEISPVDFIPSVTRLNRAHELDIWVIQKVFDWIDACPSLFGSVGGFAINLSATSLGHPEVTECILSLLEARPEVSADKIIFEITESAAIESYAKARDFIREIRRRYGCKFSLDDFGTGFTSYAHLKNLRTDALKIDGSFVKDMLESPSDCAMVESMNEIAHSLGLHTVAEYVESEAILDKLREIGVDYAQGYAIHRPCPIDAIAADGGAR